MRNDYYRCAGTGVLIKNTALAGDFADDLASPAASSGPKFIMWLSKLAAEQQDPSTWLKHRCSKRTSRCRIKFFKLDGQHAALKNLISTLTESPMRTDALQTVSFFLVVVGALCSYLCMQIRACPSLSLIGWCFPNFMPIGWSCRTGQFKLPRWRRLEGSSPTFTFQLVITFCLRVLWILLMANPNPNPMNSWSELPFSWTPFSSCVLMP